MWQGGATRRWVRTSRVMRVYRVVLAGSFFFSSRRRHTRCGRDWSSDVCSSDLDDLSHALARGTDRLQAQVMVGVFAVVVIDRSEERRVGKECRSRWSPYH